MEHAWRTNDFIEATSQVDGRKHRNNHAGLALDGDDWCEQVADRHS